MTARDCQQRRRRSLMGLMPVAVGMLFAGGCAYTGSLQNYIQNGFQVGPDYRKPVAAVEQDWIDAQDRRILRELPRRNDWWTVFNDPQMTGLVQSAFQQNLTLGEAGLRVLEARAQRGIAVGYLFPQQQQLGSSFSRFQYSATSIDNRPLIATQVPRAFDIWHVGMSAGWEFDVWGKFRRNIESANALLDASIEEYDDILVCLLGETATAYVEVRTAQQRLAYARQNVVAQKGLLGIAQSRFKAGEIDELDVLQAQINVANTEALIPEFEALERKAELRLCVLLGIPPKDLTGELGPGGIPSAPPTVAVGIPADLLRRRPDVRKAERDVAAQSAQIGAAAADLLPQLSLRGSIGTRTRNLRDLFGSGSLTGLAEPGFQWDILNYGRIANSVLAQDAKFQQQVLHYQQTVLRANADVERALVSFLQAQERVKFLTESVKANQEAVKIASDQYKDGEITFNQVFTLQSYLVQEQDALAVEQGNVATSLIAVYKAMGGGWEIRLEPGFGAPHAPPEEIDPGPPAHGTLPEGAAPTPQVATPPIPQGMAPPLPMQPAPPQVQPAQR